MKNSIDFTKNNGLVPVIIRDFETGTIYMLGFMNKEALRMTISTGFVHFWSRTRKRLWMKGEESGNNFSVKECFIDCDNDTLLLHVQLMGKNACHTGTHTCFTKKFNPNEYDI